MARTLITEALEAHKGLAVGRRKPEERTRAFSLSNLHRSPASVIARIVSESLSSEKPLDQKQLSEECARKGVPTRYRGTAWLWHEATKSIPLSLTPVNEAKRWILPRISGATYRALGEPQLAKEWQLDLPVNNEVVGEQRRPTSPLLHPVSEAERELYLKVTSGEVPGLPLQGNPLLDVRCLLHGRRISESIMDRLFGKLAEWGSLNPEWAFVQSDLFAHLRSSSPPHVGACQRLAKLLSEHDFVMLPCCLHDHWILVIIRSTRLVGNPANRAIYIFNSLGSHLERQLLSILNAALGTSLPERQMWPLTWSSVTIPCQRQKEGSVDCGIHVIHNALSLTSRYAIGLVAGPRFSPVDFRIRAAAAIASPVTTSPWSILGSGEYESD
jgi:hypothetical protein